MNIERHSLAKELPEFKDKIHDLKLSDGHFSKLFKDYHEVDNEVIRIEDGVEHSSDEYLESLKKKRLWLKESTLPNSKKCRLTVNQGQPADVSGLPSPLLYSPPIVE
ncbi:YdcH family protein [Pseudoalteromonas maricaloris]